MIEKLKLHKIPVLLLLTSCAFFWSFAYDLERTDFVKLFSLYAGLFFLGWKFFQLEKNNFQFLLVAALLFRLIFLIAIPNLSQDFYRFIWDGKLLLEGINPYLNTPVDYFSQGNLPFDGARELYFGMGELSAGNPTNYPPINQLIFALAALLGGKSIIGAIISMRTIIIAADLGIFYFGRKLLRNLNLPENRIFWYLLNPFIIIELTGNLHFEGVMLFFLITALYLFQQKKWLWSAVILALSVSVKLLPLIFLPLFFQKLGAKKAIKYYSIVCGMNLLLFLPFFSIKFLNNYLSSINLWFQKFEFNASFYYLIRWIGYQAEGYNIIQSAGPLLGVSVLLFVLVLAFFRKNRSIENLLISMVLAISFYLFAATTVHPWYLATPLLLSVFTQFKFVQVWSLVVVLSYFTYSHQAFEENMWLIALEYGTVFGVLGYEIFIRNKATALQESGG